MIAGVARKNSVDTFRRERPHAPGQAASQIINTPIPHLLQSFVWQGNIGPTPKVPPPTRVGSAQGCVLRLGGTSGGLHCLSTGFAQRLVSDGDKDRMLTGRQQESIVL